MPYGRRGFSGRRRNFGPRPVINSIKNSINFGQGITGTLAQIIFAKAVTTPDPTIRDNVSHGSLIKAIYCTLDGCGLAASGVLNIMNFYLMKNPGNNLTVPDPRSVGGSNEKKFIFRQWQFMIMRNQDGNTPFHWEGWIKIPKRYHRMGTDDVLELVVQCSSGATGHFSSEFIYKWYS